MTIRIIVLRSMLCALFLACATAIVAIFELFNTQFSSCFVGSSVLVAIGCALLLPVMPKEDTQRIFLAGLVWIGVVVFEVLAGIFLIWSQLVGGGWLLSDSVAFSMPVLFVGYCVAFVPMQQLRLAQGPLLQVSRLATWLIGFVTAGIIVALIISGIISSSLTVSEKLMGSWFTLLCGSIVLSCCACGLIRSAPLWRKVVAIFGLVVTGAAVACWLHCILSRFTQDLWILQWAFVLSGIAVGMGVLSLGKALPLGRIESWLLPWITFLTIAVGWLAGSFAVLSESKDFAEPTGRLLSATIVLDGCLGLTVIIFYVIGRRGTNKEWAITGALLACPRCGKKSTFSVGEHPCTHCGLRVLLAFRDVKCAQCQHDVRHLPIASPCPECGLAIENSAGNYLLAGATGTDAASA